MIYYVVRCHTSPRGLAPHLVLGYAGVYRPGDLLTPTNIPTRDPNRAAIYSTDGDGFPFDDKAYWGSLADFFEPVAVKITLAPNIKLEPFSVQKLTQNW